MSGCLPTESADYYILVNELAWLRSRVCLSSLKVHLDSRAQTEIKIWCVKGMYSQVKQKLIKLMMRHFVTFEHIPGKLFSALYTFSVYPWHAAKFSNNSHYLQSSFLFCIADCKSSSQC